MRQFRVYIFLCHYMLIIFFYQGITDDKESLFFVTSAFSSPLLNNHCQQHNIGFIVSRCYHVSPPSTARSNPQQQHPKHALSPKCSLITSYLARKNHKSEVYRQESKHQENVVHQQVALLQPKDKDHTLVKNKSRARRRVNGVLRKFGLNQLVKRWKAVSFQTSTSRTDDGSNLMPESSLQVKTDEMSGTNDSNSSVRNEQSLISVTSIHDLHKAILIDRRALKDIIHQPCNDSVPMNSTLHMSHPVLSLMAQRIKDRSTPSKRPSKDKAILSLSIEGGGMRGAVSAGMAAAIVSLGLMDVFDSVYGSSAGSIVGAYMISRQMCVDVYTEILVAAKEIFVSKRRMLTNLIYSAATEVVRRSSDTITALGDSTIGHASISWTRPISQRISSLWTNSSFSLPSPKLKNRINVDLRLPELQLVPPPMPGMNLTFVVEGIMNNRGLRPLDWESFQRNDAKQPLHIVSSTVREGQIETVTFSSLDGDFGDYPPQNSRNKATIAASKKTKKMRGRVFRFFRNKQRRRQNNWRIAHSELNQSSVGKSETFCVDEPQKRGLLVCLEASMNVPGAAGLPLKLLRRMHQCDMGAYNSSSSNSVNNITVGFDAFCYEPIPYRSAIKDGATHVLALRSRPEGFLAGTQPTIYERLIAPLYFYANELPQVARYFERGGQQYRYLEDLLVLENGLNVGLSRKDVPVSVPPTDILYGLDVIQDTNVQDWKKAHLYPLSLPKGATELSTISTEKGEVLQAVRDGYAAAFDLLAPLVGLDLKGINMTGSRVAELVFPDQDVAGTNDNVLMKPIHVKGEEIIEFKKRNQKRISDWLLRRKGGRTLRRLVNLIRGRQRVLLGLNLSSGFTTRDRSRPEEVLTFMKQRETELLLSSLPGFQLGKFPHLSKHLRA